ncbi:right-handed parallel beta-helix repeat-containing protein [Confluentibacter lentus]|uniref:right-handed parallel beta-helix repeat-containing protein n=1 Tax=Confluentibacter lentus TaxID=1699412 RepID=UPI000C2863D4|nr:right-handed parallel beta-helix repeat-containing protein [Confluentibacter lentus]
MDKLKMKFSNNLLFFFGIIFLFFLIPTITFGQKVNASTFGYNENDATKAFKLAIESSNDTIVFDKGIWNIGPINLNNISGKTIIFESGVIVKSLPDKFKATNASLLKMINCNNIEIIGYGAEFKMNKEEYSKYNDSEHRMSIALYGVNNVKIKGLLINESGGDGIYISSTGNPEDQKPSKNIEIQDCVIKNQYRQGMSIISVENLVVKNCIFTKTSGVLPGAGLDIEPNNKYNKLKNIYFEGCSFTYNDHAGIALSLSNLDINSDPLDITFNKCYLSMNHSETNTYAAGEIVIGANDLSPVKGRVQFDECFIDGSKWGILYTRKSSNAFHVTFNNCAAINICQAGSYNPILMEVPNYRSPSGPLGGFTFQNLYLEFNNELPFLQIRGSKLRTLKGLESVHGHITVKAPYKIAEPINYINYNASNNKNVDFEYTILD